MARTEGGAVLLDALGALKDGLNGYAKAVADAVQSVERTVAESTGQVDRGRASLVTAVQAASRASRRGREIVASQLLRLEGEVVGARETAGANAQRLGSTLDKVSDRWSQGHARKAETLAELGAVASEVAARHETILRTQGRIAGAMATVVDHEAENELAAAAIRALWYNNAACLEYWNGRTEEARHYWQHGLNLAHSGFDERTVFELDADLERSDPSERLPLVLRDWYELAADVSATRLPSQLADLSGDGPAADVLSDVLVHHRESIESERSELERNVWPWIERVNEAAADGDVERFTDLLSSAPRTVRRHPLCERILDVLAVRERRWSKATAFLPCWVNSMTDAFNRHDLPGLRRQLDVMPESLRRDPNVRRVEGLVLAVEERYEEAAVALSEARDGLRTDVSVCLALAGIALARDDFEDHDRWMASAEACDPMNSRVAAWRRDRPSYRIKEG